MAKILVVDDSPTELKLVADAINKNGHEIMTATNGDDAIKAALGEKPDLIVLDVIMPGKDGFQVCRELKRGENTSSIKIIMVTSKNQKTDEYWGIKQGADLYITKPFNPFELSKSIEKLLD